MSNAGREEFGAQTIRSTEESLAVESSQVHLARLCFFAAKKKARKFLATKRRRRRKEEVGSGEDPAEGDAYFTGISK